MKWLRVDAGDLGEAELALHGCSVLEVRPFTGGNSAMITMALCTSRQRVMRITAHQSLKLWIVGVWRWLWFRLGELERSRACWQCMATGVTDLAELAELRASER